MKIIFAGGGTAGHVEPALATAREWMANHPGDQCIFLGTHSGLETRLVPEAGFELKIITRVRVPRKISFQLLKVPFSLIHAFIQCRTVIRSADLLIGFGGYVSGPAYLAAAASRIPFVIHEANAKPGLANRLGARFTSHVGLAQPISSRLFSRAQVVGLPLRADVVGALEISRGRWTQARSEAKRQLGFNHDQPLILITGGSQGSIALNKVAAQSRAFLTSRGIQVLHSVGKGNELPDTSENYRAVSYLEDMATAYLAADLIISRSGAVTCSEVNALGKFALFIPLPIGNGEQEVNAQSLVRQGRAEVLHQDFFTWQWIEENIERLFSLSRSRTDEGSESDLHAAEKIVALMEHAHGE